MSDSKAFLPHFVMRNAARVASDFGTRRTLAANRVLFDRY